MIDPEDRTEDAELDAFLEKIRERHGHDFRRYARSGLRRRLAQLGRKVGAETIGDLEAWVTTDRFGRQAVIDALTIPVSEMFRDPPFFAAFRREVVPYLRTFPTLKLWVAGCASGEEAHSLAIVLHEEGLAARSRIHATDVSATALARARGGIYSAADLKTYADNYRQALGTRSFPGYFTIAHGHAAIDPAITRTIHFAEHDLVSDEVFGEMNVIFCRNVLIYFVAELQDACLRLLRRSLVPGGYLALGLRELLRSSTHASAFEEVAPGSRIFRARHAPASR